MATVPSNPTLMDVYSVFTGGSNVGLRALYRGGSYVQNLSVYSGVSATAPQLRQFSGLIYPAADLVGYSINGGGISGGGPLITVAAGIYFWSNGTYQEYQSSTQSGFDTFSSGTYRYTGTSSTYEIQFNKTSGETPAGDSVNTWLSLAATRNWYIEKTGGYSSGDCSGTVYIRDASTQVVVDSAALSIWVNIEV